MAVSMNCLLLEYLGAPNDCSCSTAWSTWLTRLDVMLGYTQRCRRRSSVCIFCIPILVGNPLFIHTYFSRYFWAFHLYIRYIPKKDGMTNREDTYYAPTPKALLYSLVYIGRKFGEKYGEATHTGLIRVALSTFVREHEKTYGPIPDDEIEKIKTEWASKVSQGA